jgi:geranylgeranyl pyrophosphate synthase
VAVECLHTYSLIHDDLPCIDDSELRRGRRTCHIEFGEATAVLAGDALLTHAFYLLADAYSGDPALASTLSRDLAHAAGSRRLIGGQMEDITTEGDVNDPARLEYIHENKTAALVEASLKMGVRLASEDSREIDAAAEMGRYLGLAYQMVDDILDATGDSEALGKSTGQDIKNETMSAVRVLGLDEARRRVGNLTGRAVAACQQLKGDTRFLVSLVKALEHRVH